jgi:hypothetical protein
MWSLWRASLPFRSDLFRLLGPLTLAKSHAWAAAVLIDEFDAAGNTRVFDLLQRGRIYRVSAHLNHAPDLGAMDLFVVPTWPAIDRTAVAEMPARRPPIRPKRFVTP